MQENAHSPILWRHFLSWYSFLSDDFSLCLVGIKLAGTSIKRSRPLLSFHAARREMRTPARRRALLIPPAAYRVFGDSQGLNILSQTHSISVRLEGLQDSLVFLPKTPTCSTISPSQIWHCIHAFGEGGVPLLKHRVSISATSCDPSNPYSDPSNRDESSAAFVPIFYSSLGF